MKICIVHYRRTTSNWLDVLMFSKQKTFNCCSKEVNGKTVSLNASTLVALVNPEPEFGGPHGDPITWICGRAPGGIKGQSHWSGGQTAKPPGAFTLSQPQKSAKFSENMLFLRNKKFRRTFGGHGPLDVTVSG